VLICYLISAPQIQPGRIGAEHHRGVSNADYERAIRALYAEMTAK
jgi:hypothetical protein